MRPSPRIAALLLVACFVGCKGDPRPLGWELEFESSAALDRATVVEAVILRGACDGEETSSTEIVKGELSTATVPVLADGRWCFVGRARDERCTLFAEGTTEVDLPTAGPVVVVMMARPTEVPACSTTFCDGGRCSATPVDGGMTDACTGTETVCDDEMDNDCNGDTDCADEACADDPACEACATVTCGACELCRGGECFPAEDESPCAGGMCWGGSCCVGCWDGISCRIGDTDASCGASGDRCASCVGCGACTDGACAASMPDRTPCAAGTGLCAVGVCCTGCIDSVGACSPGDGVSECGIGGTACADCGECGACTAGACSMAPDETPCPDGLCQGGACCDGCWDGMSCRPGTAPTACGGSGSSCSACLPCQGCTDGACVTSMIGDSCVSASMQNGTCRGPALICCAGCWDGSTCLPGTSDMQCGTLGNACQDCGSFDCRGGFCR